MKKMIFIILVFLTSCSSTQISQKPTRREINKAMKYADWEYKLPQPKFTMR